MSLLARLRATLGRARSVPAWGAFGWQPHEFRPGAWQRGEWRWEGFSRTDDLARHLLGALLMGMGGVYAMGCSFGQGITGLSTLNWGSLLAVASMVLGSWGTLRLQLWQAERQA